MDESDPRLDWIQRYADGLASPEEVVRLQEALRADPDLRRAYLDYVHLDNALEAAAAGMEPARPQPTLAKIVRVPRRRFALGVFFAAAAMIALVATIGGRLGGGWGVAVEIVQSDEARWRGLGAAEPRAGDRLTLDRIELGSGALQLRLVASGVLLKMSAPFKARFETPMRLRMAHGRLSADVGKGGVGFSVVTDAGEVVDLGTSFGVEADSGGESRVAVFSGQVKVRPGTAGQGRAFTTLSEGEAVRFSAVAGLRRWQQVAMAAAAAGILSQTQSAIVGTVQDNLEEGELRPFYGVVAGGMVHGSLAFTDKVLPTWAPAPTDPLPPWIEGADLIRTYNQFRHQRDYKLAITLHEPATVFVMVDVRQPEPDWLTERFVNTGTRIVVGPWQVGIKDKPGVELRADGLPYLSFAVWRADAGPGEIKLGATRNPEHHNEALMYGIAVKARAIPGREPVP